ncbi:DASH complex subunit Duo1-domain-containing protein [Kickxella alabastrina]|uniref:DASH complex subunit Duo1-domain-containing protein n=1 Tax=Kickxella alabastrina TaxID=61397 RepID=UPI002220FA1B|nr:DASH complex subunit Duo1-domain-containing protein [Kickxella alabastrina]KAI7824240.1 DASH complex subunit Duo1-domain-containing protein [Kickxella alabastrina]
MNAKRIGKQQDGLSIPGNSQQQHQHPGEGEEPVDTELEELRRVRRALSKMNQGIENVQHQMKYFNSNVSQTTQLLDIWVRILSQTAHNKAYMANEDWHGGSMDTAKLNDLAQRDRQREEEAERRAMELEERHERERGEARERERRRAEAVEAEAAARQQTQVTRPGIVPGRRPPPAQALVDAVLAHVGDAVEAADPAAAAAAELVYTASNIEQPNLAASLVVGSS